MGEDSDDLDSEQDRRKTKKETKRKKTPKEKKVEDDEDEDVTEEKAKRKKKTKTPRKKQSPSDEESEEEDSEEEKEKKKKKSPKKKKKSAPEKKSGKSSESERTEVEKSKLGADKKAMAVLKKKGITLSKIIHQGRCSLVYKADENGKLAAVRAIFLDKINREPVRQRQKFLPREIATLATVRHENLIEVREVIRINSKILVVMEMMKDGTLSEYLTLHGPLTEAKAATWFTAIAKAVEYLHDECRIAHRNIKTDNVLLNGDILKLSLAGFPIDAWDFEQDKPILCTTMCGTHQYKSPQLIRGQPYDPFAADCWSMGVVLWQLVNAKYPFSAPNTDKDVMVAQQTDPDYLEKAFTKKFSPELVKLLQDGLFVENEKERMPMSKVLKHPWIKKFVKPSSL